MVTNSSEELSRLTDEDLYLVSHSFECADSIVASYPDLGVETNSTEVGRSVIVVIL